MWEFLILFILWSYSACYHWCKLKTVGWYSVTYPTLHKIWKSVAFKSERAKFAIFRLTLSDEEHRWINQHSQSWHSGGNHPLRRQKWEPGEPHGEVSNVWGKKVKNWSRSKEKEDESSFVEGWGPLTEFKPLKPLSTFIIQVLQRLSAILIMKIKTP